MNLCRHLRANGN